MSGDPGRVLVCNSIRRRGSERFTIASRFSSGLVPEARIMDITSLRLSGVQMSMVSALNHTLGLLASVARRNMIGYIAPGVESPALFKSLVPMDSKWRSVSRGQLVEMTMDEGRP